MHWDASESTTVSATSSTSNWWAEEIQCEGEAWEHCNKQSCSHSAVSFALLLQTKTCTKSKPVSRKMTHPRHLKEFLQLGKKMQFLVSSSFDFLLLLSLIQPLFFLHAFLPAATLKTSPPSSSTAVDKSRCSCRLLFQGLLALLKDLSTLNPMNFTENHSMASFPGMATLEKKPFQLCSVRACTYYVK